MPIYPVLNDKKKPVKKNGYKKYRVVVSYTDNNGRYKKIERIAYGLDNAKELELELTKKANKKELETPISYNELKEQFLLAKRADTKPGTYRGIEGRLENHITPFFKKYKVNKINSGLIQKWKHEINEKGLGIDTRKNLYATLRSLLNYAVKLEYINKNPIRSIENFKDPNYIKKEMDFYTADEFKRFITIARNEAIRIEEETKSIKEWHYYTFFMISFFLGTRKGETYAFNWNNWQNKTLKVEKSIDQKNKGLTGDIVGAPKTKNSLRVNKLPEVLENVLQEHYERCSRLDGFDKSWYICGGIKPIRDTTISNRNIAYAKSAGVKKIRIHDFRHSNASLLINNGILPKEVARRLGDTENEIMRTYSHLYPQEEEKVIEILNNIDI